MLILVFIQRESELLSTKIQRGAGGGAILECMWLLALEAGVSAGGVINTAHTPGATCPERCPHCSCRASSCMGVGVGNRGEGDCCWIRKGWNLTSPTSSRCECFPLGLQWGFGHPAPTVALLLLPGTHHLWDGLPAGHGALRSCCPAQAQISFSFASSRDSPLLSLEQNPSVCLPTWWEMQRDVC